MNQTVDIPSGEYASGILSQAARLPLKLLIETLPFGAEFLYATIARSLIRCPKVAKDRPLPHGL